MKMTAEQREVLQLAVLRVLDANHTRFGLGISAITLWASRLGFADLTLEKVEPELEYLEEKKLIESVTKELEPANRSWKRTAKGRDFLAERGF